jgi:hypothetical protein
LTLETTAKIFVSLKNTREFSIIILREKRGRSPYKLQSHTHPNHPNAEILFVNRIEIII